MKPIFLMSLVFSSCSSLNESLQFGAGMGAATGAAAAFSAQKAIGGNPSLEDVAVGAGVGLGLGLLSSYLIHKSLADEPRPYSENESVQTHFGDLPPSPFIMPPIGPRRTK